MISWPQSGGCFVIGEVAMAHEGSLGMAHAFIDAIARTGAQAVKFQTHVANAESTAAEPFRIALSGQDDSRYAYWQRTAFSEDGWRALVEHAHRKDLCFVCSPFSEEAVDLLVRVGADILKIASGEVGNLPLLAHAARSGLPVMISSGMSPLEEVDLAMEMLKAESTRTALFQCTSAYPCPPERLGLNLLSTFRDRYACPVGLSDHSGTIYAGLAAATLGADMLEVHVCFSREMYGPDVPASLIPDDLARLVEGTQFIRRALAHSVDKDAQAAMMGDLRDVFTKSIVARSALKEGTVVHLQDLAFKKPGTGIPARYFAKLVGKRLRVAVLPDHIFSAQDFED